MVDFVGWLKYDQFDAVLWVIALALSLLFVVTVAGSIRERKSDE